MHKFHAHCRQALADIRDQGRYRNFTPLAKQSAVFPRYRLDGRDVTVWSANDYLGMGTHPDVVAAAIATAQDRGAGAGGTRNIAGSNPLHTALEAELAALH